MRTLLKNGTVLDPSGGFYDTVDILLENDKIAYIGKYQAGGEAIRAERVIDAAGRLVTPGLIDVHVHLRDPGQTHKEDLTTGTKAAAHGGFSSIVCMPNTKPVMDNGELLRQFIERTKTEAAVNVFPTAAITRDSEGRILNDLQALLEAGAVGFTDDGKVLQNSALMYRALLDSHKMGAPISQHAEDLDLAAGTVINKGAIADRLQVAGDPEVSEIVIVARDLQLAAATGGHLHVGHISTAKAVHLVREAKAAGIHVTAEVTPHHLVLTDEDVIRYGTNGKMRPPLRTAKDVEALRAALADGTIDCIATDHAPHSTSEKEVELARAANGILGLETAVGIILTRLVRPGLLDLRRAIAAWTSRPAEIYGLKGKGKLQTGYDADLTVIDLEKKWVVEPDKFFSKSRNTPFTGWELQGKAVMTIVKGQVVWAE